jgi:DEAD/DEAH box helicase domain-containing protein
VGDALSSGVTEAGAPLDGASFHAFLEGVGQGHAQVRAHAFLPPRRGRLEHAGEPWDAALTKLGLRAYGHQALALRHLGAGRDVVLATGTASGKSLVYQLPALLALPEGGTTLAVMPTKALAADQEGRWRAAARSLGLDGSAIRRYDGDTPVAERREARAQARVIITNPDMLHYGLLPFHEVWHGFLAHLRWLVLDELHAYRGVLGVHVANVVRRALRLCARHGSEPTVVAASATIGNPAEHLARLTGRPAVAVDHDDAPRGPREVVVWRPADLPGDAGRRRSAQSEAAELGVALARAGVKTLVFTNTRRSAELVRRYAVQLAPPALQAAILSYRGGYLPEDRERIAAAFREGDARLLVATSALELGVDVGGVDAVVLVGYPGSHAAFWQRSGRAGRGRARSLTVWIPGPDPLDEYYLLHPERLLDGEPEDAVADPWNDELHPAHLRCAAAEWPLEQGEALISPGIDLASVPGLRPIAPTRAGEGARWSSVRRYPHRAVRVRGGLGPGRVRLRDAEGRALGLVDGADALRELHPGAVYLHQGEAFVSVRLDLHRGEAVLLPHIEDYYTQARSETDVEVLERWPQGRRPGEPHAVAGLPAPPPGVQVGRVRVRARVTGYVRRRFHGRGLLDERPLDLPEVAFDTQALWFELDAVADAPPRGSLPAAMHALEHTLIGLLPAFVLCERADVGGVSYPSHPISGCATVFVYDGHPGGVGYARAGAAAFDDWLAAVLELLSRCPCEGGCPRCVLSPKCGNGNQFLDKDAAHALGTAWAAWSRARQGATATRVLA